MLAEEMLAHEGAVVGLEVLVLAVDRVFHHAQQVALGIARQQRVPVRTPDHLDDVPAVAAEATLQLLDDLAVAPHRAIEPLQVAVDDEDEVVELFARRQADRPERLRLVHFAVAAEHPHLAPRGVGNAARVQVLEEARLVDRLDRSQAHADGRELPEVRHQLRMRVGRDALAVDIAAEVVELLLGEPALEEGPRVDTWRAVSLEVDQVAAEVRARCTPEVVETDFHQRVDRRVAGDVAAEVALAAVGAHHHRHRVPAHVGADALLQHRVARRVLLKMRRDGVEVRRVGRKRNVRARAARLVDQGLEQEVRALRPFAFEDGLERLDPFLGLECIGIVGSLRNCGHRCLLMVGFPADSMGNAT